jgi:hypothetical protein
MEIIPVLIIAGQKSPQHSEGYLEFFATLHNFLFTCSTISDEAPNEVPRNPGCGKHRIRRPAVNTSGAFVCWKVFLWVVHKYRRRKSVIRPSPVKPHVFLYYVSKCSIFMITKNGLPCSEVQVRQPIALQCLTQWRIYTSLWFVLRLLYAVVIRSHRT